MDQIELLLATGKATELEQAERRMSELLRQANEALRESDERFRDLFDEAPMAYVYESLDSRIIQANRAAMANLGHSARRDRRDIRKVFGTRFP
jgi:PAS domain-containing protein